MNKIYIIQDDYFVSLVSYFMTHRYVTGNYYSPTCNVILIVNTHLNPTKLVLKLKGKCIHKII